MHTNSNENEIIVGLDIGTTKIAAIVGRKNDKGKIEILGYGKAESIGVKRGVVINIDNTVASIKKAVEEAERKSNVTIEVVKVGIAGQHIKSHQHRGSIIRDNSEEEIDNKDIDDLINSMYNVGIKPGEEIISVIPQEFTLDDEPGIKQPVGMMGNTLEANFHIITGLTAAVKNIIKCVNKAGLTCDKLILEPLASSDSVLNEEEKEAGVVLVDIGGGTTDITIFQEKILRHTAVIPFGGSAITEDVKEGCSIIKRHAEDLKVKFGSALSNKNRIEEVVSIPGLRGRPPKEISLKNLSSIIQARIEEIIEQVYFEIKNSGYENKLIGGIVLTGGGAQLKHIRELTEFVTGMDTRIGYPTEHLASGTQKEITLPMYATAIGLVYNGIKENESQKEEELKKSSDLTETVETSEDSFKDTIRKPKVSNKFLKKIIDLFEEDNYK
ncbi:MAG: cell division protein FtsA [Bacteroidota bacterium]|nr:cell division protein FtsA [Bacteroidota bacterium]